MTTKNCSRLCCLFLFALSAGMLCADDAPTEAKQLLVAAHQSSDLSAILPYELRGTVIVNPGGENAKKGTITIYRDHDKSRSELRIEDYQEVKLVRGNKLYIYRSTPLPVPMLGRLAEADHYWDKLTEDGDGKFSDISKKKVQNQGASCFEVKGGQRHRLCFDSARNVLLEIMDQQKAVEFSNYSNVDQHFFPGKITVFLELAKEEKPILVVENIEVTKAHFVETAFAVPPHAMEFDTCDKMTEAKPLQTPRPEFSPMVMRRNSANPAVHVYGIVGKEGVLENVKILSSDPEVQQTIAETIKKWRYTPAMCGTNPVATEQEIQVSLGGGGGGGGDSNEGGRRGR